MIRVYAPSGPAAAARTLDAHNDQMFSYLPTWIPLVAFLVDWALRLSLAAVIIVRRRPVATSLAWLAVLMFVPVIGLVAYVLVGENRLGSRRIRRYEALTKGIHQEAVRIWHHRHSEPDHSQERYDPIARYGTNATGFPALRNNRLTCLNSAEDFLDCVCEDIACAKSHVHILTYIWQVGGGARSADGQPRMTAGDRVGQALIEAARRGVCCRVLVDAVGSSAFLRSELAGRMRQSGIQVVAALPANVFRSLFQRLDLRNHRKIIVVDGVIGYAGSQNITDDTFRSKPRRQTGPWIDSSLRVQGPAVYALQAVFLRDWMLDSDVPIGALDQYIPPLPPFTPAPRPEPGARTSSTTSVQSEAPCVVQVIPSGPGGGGQAPQAIHQAMLTTIFAAHEELVMTTPYFVPDDATRSALMAAATRGVSVTLVMPKVSDSRLVASASRSHYLDLLESGVRILHYRKGLLHAKTMTVDRNIAIIGSANMDARSFWLNFEVTLFVYDDDFGSVVRFMQTQYIADSDEVHLDEWRKRSLWETFRDNAAQLLGPLL